MHIATFQHLLEEEPQRRHSHLDRAGCELSFLQQEPLESLHLRGSQSIRRLTEILCELFDREDVASNCGGWIVVAVGVLHHPLALWFVLGLLFSSYFLFPSPHFKPAARLLGWV